ncbi:MAG TPA: TerB family tellurite resistance protein [Cyclobacteriaceae bacterium]|nr:TerB family tellurite resistance protein [Cyclobacteriaceae bacterium]HMV08640.1 TerB family tellurite resistance protein [Cyclobacteriaceae bacterium]HMV91339.1 TerB family tellurite resistance protein [Cyclobacteriaceae bacterium]HMX00151.1 TerB family tellurite resistance protein [Cyclobacteriaceae bacterium]HMX52180.1 TerB family tellurite resistance protein [Cyclobacteriaceae bacterium]
MDIVTRKKLNLLIQLAEADKHFARSEREMIYRIAKDRNFSEDDVNELIKNPEPIGSLGALSIDQKLDYLLTSIQLMFADQKIFDSELTFCRNVAIKLGFKKGIIDYFVENYEKKSREELRLTAMEEYL